MRLPLKEGAGKAINDLVLERLLWLGAPRDVMSWPLDDCLVFQMPPLFTTESLCEQPLQPYLSISSGQSFEEITEAYDKALSAAIRDKLSIAIGSGGLRLKRAQRLSLFAPFSEECPDDIFLVAIGIAALVAYNFEHEMSHGPNTFLVTSRGKRFGVRASQCLNSEGRPVRVMPQRTGPERLCDVPRSSTEFATVPLYYAGAASWVNQMTANESGLLLALSILRRERFKGLEYKIDKILTTREIAAALVYAKRWPEVADEPYEMLKGALVPEIITIDRFKYLFGYPRVQPVVPVAEKWRSKWTHALYVLEEELLEGRYFAVTC
jgi:hypothetical protein